MNRPLHPISRKTPFTYAIFFALICCTFLSNAQDRRTEGNLVLEDIPIIPPTIRSSIQPYRQTRSASLVDWLPGEEGVIISTRFGNTRQLHIVQQPGAARSQITFFDEPVSNAAHCPTAEFNGFLFTKDEGGNEFSQIFQYDMDSRKYELLSDGTSVNYRMVWSNAGDQFAFTSTRRNGKDFDIYVSNSSSPKKAELKIGEGGGRWYVVDWSPDDSQLLVNQYLSSTASNAYVFDLETNELQKVNEGGGEFVFEAFGWGPSGEHVYATTNDGMEFNTLVKYDLKEKKQTYLTDHIPWDVNEYAANKERTKAGFIVNENGFSQLYFLNTKTDELQLMPNLPRGYITNLKFHPERDELGMTIDASETPGDIFSIDLNTAAIKRWTTGEVGGLNTAQFPKPTLITYPTFDEVNGAPREIPAFVYRPTTRTGKFPVLITIHGGPEARYVPDFSPYYAFLANELGIAVIAPNVRGSSGYGKAYLKLDNGFKREDSVKDIGKLIEWIRQNPDFDADRIAVYGGSYGGYMVLASMFHYADQLRCGVDIVGISNFVSFLEGTEAYRRDMRRAEYGDEREPEMRAFLESISPTEHVEKITKPLFVIQGANDPRVPAKESEQMVEAIRAQGGKVWYMLGKNEGHGFDKKDNQEKMSEAVVFFLKTYLLD